MPVISTPLGDQDRLAGYWWELSMRQTHQIAEEYLAEHPVRTGVFLVLVARAPATV